jgi:hypothetical protein
VEDSLIAVEAPLMATVYVAARLQSKIAMARLGRIPALSIVMTWVTLLAPSTASAQGRDGAREASRTRPGWLPRWTKFGPVRPAEKAEMLAKLEEIERILLRIEEVARPVGFEILPSLTIQPSSEPGGLVTASYGIGVFVPTRAANPDGAPGIQVFVNPGVGQIHVWDQRSHSPTASGYELYFEEGVIEPFPGATHVYFRYDQERTWYLALLTSGGESPFLPVSKAEYAEAMIWQLEGGTKAKELAEYRQSLAKTPYQHWLEDAPVRQKRRDEAMAGVARVNPTEAEKVKRGGRKRSVRRATGSRHRKSGTERTTRSCWPSQGRPSRGGRRWLGSPPASGRLTPGSSALGTSCRPGRTAPRM